MNIESEIFLIFFIVIKSFVLFKTKSYTIVVRPGNDDLNIMFYIVLGNPGVSSAFQV